MNTITAIRESNRRQQVKVFLDGKLAFSLKAEVAAREGLQVGQELSSAQIAALQQSDRQQRCLSTAERYLSYRPRSEAELRERLRQRGFDSDSVAATMAQLKDQGLVDDKVFAQFWKDNRELSPRSRRLIRLELRRKGVSDDIIAQMVATSDDEDSAYQAALSKTRRLSLSDYDSFRRRLSDYLQRRGFTYSVTKHTVERVWQERRSNC